MRLIRSFFIAFSMYSRIPVPQFEWKEEEMKYAMCFFPWVGAAIGLCLFGWHRLCRALGIGDTAYLLVGTALPLLITGGFHADGFMDTQDALSSCQSRERKLEILKDSHIGAFSVIRLALYGLIYIAAFSEIREERTLIVVCIGFALSRTLSGIGVVSFCPARKTGLLRTFSDSAGKNALAFLLLQLAVFAGAMAFVSPVAGLAALAGAAASFVFYRIKSYREFGGVTGDTAGYFLLLCEACTMAAAAAAEVVLRAL